MPDGGNLARWAQHGFGHQPALTVNPSSAGHLGPGKSSRPSLSLSVLIQQTEMDRLARRVNFRSAVGPGPRCALRSGASHRFRREQKGTMAQPPSEAGRAACTRPSPAPPARAPGPGHTVKAQRAERPPAPSPASQSASHRPGQSRRKIHLKMHSKTNRQPEAINFF